MKPVSCCENRAKVFEKIRSRLLSDVRVTNGQEDADYVFLSINADRVAIVSGNDPYRNNWLR